MDLKEKVRTLPSSSGVYLMKDSLHSIIYVGKSKNLKSRVGSYFQNSKSHPPKIVKLVKNISDFDYILTDTEFEAFMLECKLIQEIKPFYNKKMKSPHSYTYIKIREAKELPTIEISNEYLKEEGSLYFGPYTSKNTVERAIQGIKECCKIPCSKVSKNNAGCLNYSLGLCIGACLGGSAIDTYNKIIKKIIKLLQGADKSIIEDMEREMYSSSEKFDFEKAAKYRDYIQSINYLLSNEKTINFTRKNKNIAMIEYLNPDNIKFFLINWNKVLFSEKYNLDCFDVEKLKLIVKTQILLHFSHEASSSSIEIHKEELDEAQIIYSYLKNNNNNCKYVVVKKKWITSEENVYLDEALYKLLHSETNL